MKSLKCETQNNCCFLLNKHLFELDLLLIKSMSYEKYCFFLKKACKISGKGDLYH